MMQLYIKIVHIATTLILLVSGGIVFTYGLLILLFALLITNEATGLMMTIIGAGLLAVAGMTLVLTMKNRHLLQTDPLKYRLHEWIMSGTALWLAGDVFFLILLYSRMSLEEVKQNGYDGLMYFMLFVMALNAIAVFFANKATMATLLDQGLIVEPGETS